MEVRGQKLLAFGCFFVIAVVLVTPAYADILSLKTDKTFYKKGDKIIFSGIVEDDDIGEFVTIVVEDPAGNFVTLGSGYVTVDKNFTVTIDTNAKKIKEKFASHGVYNATGFVENKTNSKWVTFDFSLDGSPVVHPTNQPVLASTPQPTPAPIPQPTSTPSTSQPSSQSNANDENDGDELTIQEKIKERIELAKKLKEAQTNQPIQTGSGQIGVNQTGNLNTTTTDTISGDKADTTGTSTVPIDLSSNLLYIVIGLGGAGAAAAVVYGAKNKARHKSDAPIVKIRELSEKVGAPSEEDYALMILKNRLAKGEITIDEFNALKKALQEP